MIPFSQADRSVERHAPISVYLPAGKDLYGIRAASGIVGSVEGARLLLDFEGDVYGAFEHRTWADQVHHAWGRHSERYPTVARILAPREHFARVGLYDPREGQIDLDSDADVEAIERWIGKPLDVQQLTTSGVVRHLQRRDLRAALSSSDEAVRARTRHFLRTEDRRHEDLLSDA